VSRPTSIQRASLSRRGSEEYPYPCIRMFHFVSQMMAENPAYASVVEAGKKGDTLFLDIGCHSQDLSFLRRQMMETKFLG
jgi:hypothetical protein